MTMSDDHGTFEVMESMAISEFKARCLAVLEAVNRTGQPIQVTRRGTPIAEIVPPSRPAGVRRELGAAAGTFRIVGDIVAPASASEDWEALGG